jgi:hypothetical protein
MALNQLQIPIDKLETPISHIYGLCERAAPGILQEPLNTLTNLGFLIAAFFIYKLYRNNPDYEAKKLWDIYVLNILMVCIGIASISFHTAPSYYTEIADTAFIVIFIVVYFTSAMFRIINLKKYPVLICMMAFVFTTKALVSYFPNALNDSVAYLSSMAAIIFIAFYLNLKRRAAATAFMMASIIGCVSLFFRVVDKEVCDVVPTGTHFLWHIFNSILIYILMKQLLRSINRRARMLRMAAEHGL